MIPKKIHYFWFGGKDKPQNVIKCINSWKKYCPDYEIVEWNESNFDIDCVPYIRQAIDVKKYAFASDVGRLIVIYEQGGVYLDVDVELLKPLDEMLEHKAYMGFEVDDAINTGLGFGAEAHLPFIKELIEVYKNADFIKSDGSFNYKACTKYTTELLLAKGLALDGKKQEIEEIIIYPSDYFNPFDSLTGRISKTKNTVSVHWYNASWSDTPLYKLKFRRLIRRIFGVHIFDKLVGR